MVSTTFKNVDRLRQLSRLQQQVAIYIWVSDNTWVKRPDRLVSMPVFDEGRMVPFSDARHLCNFRLFDVGVAPCWLRCGGESMGGHAWSVTSEDAECEQGSKIKNPSTSVDGESRELQLLLFNFLCNVNTVRRTSVPPKSPPPSPGCT